MSWNLSVIMQDFSRLAPSCLLFSMSVWRKFLDKIVYFNMGIQTQIQRLSSNSTSRKTPKKLYRPMKWIQNENSNLFSRQILLFNFKIWQIGKKIHTTFEFRITHSHYKQFFLQNNFLQFNVFLCVWFKSRKGCISIKRS